MKSPSEKGRPARRPDFQRQRAQIIGLGERSFKKTYFPELQKRLMELERFRLLLEYAGEAVFLFDAASARVLDANQTAAQFTGLDRETLLSSSITDLWDPRSAEQIRELIAAVQPIEGGHSVVIGYLKSRKGEVPVETSFYQASVDGGRYAIAVARDIRERLETERALVEAKERAEHADRAKSEFLNIASHELRTPVASANLLLELLRRQLASGVAGGPTIDRIQRQLDRLTSMVYDMIDISRLERGTLSIRPELLDIRQVAREAVEAFRLRICNHAVSLEMPQEAVQVEIDPIRISQVLDNLLDNAAKYSPPDAAIDIKVQMAGNKVEISVHDRGIGISPEELTRVFSRFFRSKSDVVRRSAGLGLGLFISKEIVELHGGRISVETASGHGSTFRLEIPLKS